MDIAVKDYDDIERELAADVEKLFKEDVDALLVSGYEGRNSSILAAERKFRRLIERTYLGKNKWRPDAWRTIEEKICDEGIFTFDISDTMTVCTYVFYIEAACLYLRDGTRRKHFERLISIVSEDVRRLGAITTMDPSEDVPEEDQRIIFYAITMCRHYLQRLQKTYPDT